MVKHPLINRGALSNGIDARAGKAFSGKFLESGLQNSPPASVPDCAFLVG